MPVLSQRYFRWLEMNRAWAQKVFRVQDRLKVKHNLHVLVSAVWANLYWSTHILTRLRARVGLNFRAFDSPDLYICCLSIPGRVSAKVSFSISGKFFLSDQLNRFFWTKEPPFAGIPRTSGKKPFQGAKKFSFFSPPSNLIFKKFFFWQNISLIGFWPEIKVKSRKWLFHSKLFFDF